MLSLTSILRIAAVPALLVNLTATPAVGQVAVVEVAENFRVEPNGTILGTLEAADGQGTDQHQSTQRDGPCRPGGRMAR